jgi:hypothetical protein
VQVEQVEHLLEAMEFQAAILCFLLSLQLVAALVQDTKTLLAQVAQVVVVRSLALMDQELQIKVMQVETTQLKMAVAVVAVLTRLGQMAAVKAVQVARE